MTCDLLLSAICNKKKAVSVTAGQKEKSECGRCEIRQEASNSKSMGEGRGKSI